MLRRNHTGVLPCVLVSALVGCGGKVENQSKIPIANAPAAIAQAVCPKAWTCCNATQLMGNQNAGTDEQSCETKTTQSYQNSLNNVQHSQDLHRVLYDGDQLDACLTNIRSYTCQMLATTNHFSGVTGCDSFIKPLVDIGGACGNTFECINGWCKLPASGGGDGTCTALAKNGETCGSAQGDTPCGSGLACDGTTMSCYTLGAQGEACSDDLHCASANCSSSGSGPGTCAPPRADQCFYASGCSTAGCRPAVTAVVLLLLALFTAAARRRKSHRQGKIVPLRSLSK